MNITIVKEDNVVMIDGEALNFDFALADNIWAIQWNDTYGEVEYNDGTPNTSLNDFSDFQYLVDLHAEDKITKAEAEAQEEADRIAALTYLDKRAAEYPAIVDQLDTIYHSGVDAWKAEIKEVKDKYPKG